MSTYAYTEQQAPYGSPLETEPYANSFHQTIEAQDFMAVSAALGYENTTMTSMPMDNTTFDQGQFGNYTNPAMPPHSQHYQYPPFAARDATTPGQEVP